MLYSSNFLSANYSIYTSCVIVKQICITIFLFVTITFCKTDVPTALSYMHLKRFRCSNWISIVSVSWFVGLFVNIWNLECSGWVDIVADFEPKLWLLLLHFHLNFWIYYNQFIYTKSTNIMVLQIDEELLQEVVNMGFDRNQLVESLCNRIQNEVCALHSLLSCLLDCLLLLSIYFWYCGKLLVIG